MARGLSCPTACGILVPRPGIEPASPALEGGFFTTGPPGNSRTLLFKKKNLTYGQFHLQSQELFLPLL